MPLTKRIVSITQHHCLHNQIETTRAAFSPVMNLLARVSLDQKVNTLSHILLVVGVYLCSHTLIFQGWGLHHLHALNDGSSIETKQKKRQES